MLTALTRLRPLGLEPAHVGDVASQLHPRLNLGLGRISMLTALGARLGFASRLGNRARASGARAANWAMARACADWLWFASTKLPSSVVGAARACTSLSWWGRRWFRRSCWWGRRR